MSTTLLMPSLGDQLRAARQGKGLTQEDAAAAAGVKLSTLQKVERDVGQPNWRTIRALAKALGLSLDELAAGEDAPARPVKRPAGRPRKAD
jgi:transcriptional regulator with XRE-family HTH domain